jgi:hypothetical protein
MIKSIIALAAGALFSMNGSIIQHDTDKSIAYFNFDLYIDGVGRPFRLPLTPQLGDGTTQLTYATTSFRGQGPTNFGIYSNFGADQFTNVGVTFSQNDSGVFSYVANYTSSIFFIGGFQTLLVSTSALPQLGW